MPGIDFSPDPLLAGRNFSYFDTQLSRLGINWQELPINRPVCPYLNFNRDGQGRHTITKGQVNYWPNRYEANPPANHTKTPGGFRKYFFTLAWIWLVLSAIDTIESACQTSTVLAQYPIAIPISSSRTRHPRSKVLTHFQNPIPASNPA